MIAWSWCRRAGWLRVVAGGDRLAVGCRVQAGCNTNSLLWSGPPVVTLCECPLMLLCLDPTRAGTDLTAGELTCPHAGCGGRLGPWGHARQRWLRTGSTGR